MIKRGLLLVLLVAAIAFAYVHFQVHSYDNRIVTDLNELDTSRWARPRVAVVFGASVYSNGDLSPILEDRVDTAIELYRAARWIAFWFQGITVTPVIMSQKRCRNIWLRMRLRRRM